ncbi:hypothetical protein BDZ91DRAFT_710379 [Kalaharituber pfeilii]|nr:hypothetical protein BDZ91DRAFT_710379 [Kalaharituber pfeilii]
MVELASHSLPAPCHVPREPSTTVKGKEKRKILDDEPEEPEKCVICLDPISEKCTASSCRHSFDYICILNWLELRQSCPLCNALISELLVCTKNGKIQKHIVEPPLSSSKCAVNQISSPSTAVGAEQLALRNRSYGRRRHRRSPSLVTEDVALHRRRFVYKHKLRSLYVGSNRLSRFRNIKPIDFHTDEELVSRARMWIRRELQVWEWTNTNAEFLIEYGSAGQAEEMVAEVLGRENAQIFIHELNAFVRSPFTSLQPFDNFVQYEIPLPKSFPRTVRDDEDARRLLLQRKPDGNAYAGSNSSRAEEGSSSSHGHVYSSRKRGNQREVL